MAMNRDPYFSYIEEKLNLLALRIESRGKLNILNLHVHSENFYVDFFNVLFGYKLQNMNAVKQNVEAIDLIDSENKIVIQVSATASKEKIESALTKNLSKYKSYEFKFISICKDASHLRTKLFKNPHGLAFNPADDIFDVPSLLNVILSLNIDRLNEIFRFIKKELGDDVPPQKVESSLATIVNILAAEDFNDVIGAKYEVLPYDVDRKIEFNKLDSAKAIVNDYKVHYGRLDKIYSEFNRLGANKSRAVLDAIRRFYIDNKKSLSDDLLFQKVVNGVLARVYESKNIAAMPYEELELCVNVLVVDAFIRCKIFENPTNVTNVAP